ncbi:MAG: glycosyltransferase family 2 protein [Promethearchaeota archaeon]
MTGGSKYDLAVAYRAYPGMAKPTPVFSGDKLKFAEFCLKSFRDSLGDLRVKVWAILDGCPPEYGELFRSTFPAGDLVVEDLPGVGNSATFQRQLDILTGQDDAGVVYLAEDDYFYLPGAFPEMVEFLAGNAEVDFASPYNHPDYSTSDLHDHRREYRDAGGRRWKTVNSTTLTFLTTREALLRTRSQFAKFVPTRVYDVSIWLALTKYRVRNPWAIAKYLFRDRDIFKMVARSWLHCTRQVLFGKRWKLWVPEPSIATHMEPDLLSRDVDWEWYFERTSGKQ